MMDEVRRLSSLRGWSDLYRWIRTGLAVKVTWRCWLCGAPGQVQRLCSGCAGDLPRRPQPALPRTPRGIDAVYVPFLYAYPLREVLIRAKFSADLSALALCGEVLSDEVNTYFETIDAILPVPLSRRRFLARGYNQAQQIALPLARTLGKPLLANVLVRRRHGTPQSRLSASQRRRAIRGSFSCAETFDGQTLLIVDDVITTGATLAEVARVLQQAGAAVVVATALAATPPAP